MESSGERISLLQPTFSNSTKDKVYTWGIKIVKILGWVGVGISLKKKITEAKFFFNYTNIGHGSYFISANGYCWSHSLK